MLGLARFQGALASAVTNGRVDHDAQGLLRDLSEAGIAMTARVRRSWCEGRARRAAPLTLSALPEDQRTALLSAWVDAGGGTRSFFELEAQAFLAFIAERLDDPSHQMTLCRFERAVVRARLAPWNGFPLVPLDSETILQRSPDADLVMLGTSVHALLGALDGSRPWPEMGDAPQSLLVAPGIDGLVREASDREISLWQAVGTGVRATDDPPTAQNMLACGALRAVRVEG